MIDPELIPMHKRSRLDWLMIERRAQKAIADIYYPIGLMTRDELLQADHALDQAINARERYEQVRQEREQQAKGGN